MFLVRLKEHSSNGKRGGGGGGGGGGFYLSAHISQSIYPIKINLVLNNRGQKSYSESTLILAILLKIFFVKSKKQIVGYGFLRVRKTFPPILDSL